MRLLLVLALLPATGLGCMTAVQERKVSASMAELRARLEARADTDRESARQLADLRHTFEALQGRWASGASASKAVAVPTQMTEEIAALQARTDQLAEAIQGQARARADGTTRFEKRLSALEQSDAALADKVGLFIPDDKEELWRGAASLLASDHQGEARRYYQAFIDRFPQDSRASQAYLAIGRSYASEARYSNAAATYQRLLSRYPAAPEVPEAMWQLSHAFIQLSFCSDARALLRDLVTHYPKSQEAGEAMKQLKSFKLPAGAAECLS